MLFTVLGIIVVGSLAVLAMRLGEAQAEKPQTEGARRVVTGGTKPIGPYSPGVIRGGVLFLAGQIGLDSSTGQIVEGGVRAEARQAMVNLGSVLKEAGLGYEHVLKTTIFLADINDFAAVNEVYGGFFAKDGPFPARSTVAVAALPRGARVEIEMIAGR
jgi:2-iminobutanoate/2-iminopropanoate deaminase